MCRLEMRDLCVQHRRRTWPPLKMNDLFSWRARAHTHNTRPCFIVVSVSNFIWNRIFQMVCSWLGVIKAARRLCQNTFEIFWVIVWRNAISPTKSRRIKQNNSKSNSSQMRLDFYNRFNDFASMKSLSHSRLIFFIISLVFGHHF